MHPVTRHTLPAPANPITAARVAKAAQDFTAVALGELLKPIFETTDKSTELFGGGQGEQAWRPMMVDEIAKSIARQGGLGLSAPVAQAMLQMQEKSK